MAYTTIDDSSAFFQTATWTGNTSAPRSITNDGNSNLQPDIVWGKNRTTNGTDHELYDSTRGTGTSYNLKPNSTVQEGISTTYGQLTSFDTDGFTVNAGGTNDDFWNENGSEFVAWQWKVNGGTTASNTDGDLTSTVQVNTTAGISIFTYTGKDPIEPLDIGHGLGSVPDVFIIKRRNGGSRNWAYYHKDMDATPQNGYLRLNNSNGYAAASTWWRNEAPTSTIIKTGEQADVNQPNDTFVGYAWKEVQGFSKFGKYTGNGNANGTFVYTGFKPACVITKEVSSSGGNWRIFDNKRAGYNDDNYRLTPNENSAESTSTHLDLYSNGFKFRNTGTSYNGSGDSYIYMAWAENPFVTSTGIPTTAR
jgi:hypothetical protein